MIILELKNDKLVTFKVNCKSIFTVTKMQVQKYLSWNDY